VGRYFVTGATGFIGRELVRQLAGAGHEVRALVRRPGAAPALAAPGVAVHQGDVTEKDSMRAAMAGADGVFHVAGWYRLGVRDAATAWRVNVDGTRNVLELMRELGVPKGVYTSTVAVFGDTRGRTVDEGYTHGGPWLSVYDRTKWVAHYEVALPAIAARAPLVIVQPGGVYGPGDPSATGETLRAFLRRRLPAVPQGLTLCWGHVADTARGHVLAMECGRPGESYIIAGPAHSLVEALALASRISGIPLPTLLLPPAVLRGLAAVAGRLERVAPLPPALAAETLRVSAGVTYLGSSAKARRELGFAVRPLEDGLRETLEVELARLGAGRGLTVADSGGA
jgi:nucleoside-diphosphate-sugar epimerase